MDARIAVGLMLKISNADAPGSIDSPAECPRPSSIWLAYASGFARALPGVLLSVVFGFLAPETTMASGDPSIICDRAAERAAVDTGVPISVLRAITLTETGRERGGSTRPWPWTVNMEGKGVWFETEDSARAYAYEHFKRGARSFDVGCFQINYKWHHEAFSSLEEMFDPTANALYAARFMLELNSELGSWEEAAGAYHSRTPEYADRYKTRFASFRAQFAHQDSLPIVVASVDPLIGSNDPSQTGTSPQSVVQAPRQSLPRVNTYPLLQRGGDPAIGSLVPLNAVKGSGGLFGRGDAG